MMRPAGAAVLFAVAALLIVLASRGSAPDGQPDSPHWVFFDPVAAAGTSAPALSPEALQNRARLGIPLVASDLPLPDSLFGIIVREGGRVRHASRWLRAISVEADASSLSRIATHPAVRALRPVAHLTRARAVTATTSVADESSLAQTDSAFYGRNWHALRELRIPTLHVLGFTGRGVRVAILDTGFEIGHEAFAGRSIVRARDFVEGDSDVTDPPGSGTLQSRHGTQVWSLLGGFRPGTIVGPAYEAQFILAKVDAEPGDTRADEDRWVAGVEWADSLGARVITSSVVFRADFTDRPPIPFSDLDGNTTITTRMADEAARRGIVVVTAIGNDGPGTGTLSAPADADSVIAVGAIDALGQAATFAGGGASARGPTSNGRAKPEMSARGVGMFAASTPGSSAYETALAGTSFSTPLIAGSVAAFIQAWPELSPVAVRRALLLAGSRPVGSNNDVGVGVPDVASAILFPDGIRTSGVATIDLDQRLTTIAPRFSWAAPLIQSALRPLVYRVDIATDPVFNRVIYSDTVREAFSLSTRLPLRPAQALWWRVVATASLGVQRASEVSGPISMPNWVRLVSPAPNQVTFVDSAQPRLTWAPLEAPPPVGPFTYDVQVLSAETGQPVQPTIQNLSTASLRVPRPLAPNIAYRWRVIARTPSGAADTVESASPFVVTSTARPPTTLLHQNFPNPFPATGGISTRIWFDLANQTTVELAVFDLRGRLVRRLVPAEPSCGTVSLDAGQYGRVLAGATPDPCVLTTWDGTDTNGASVSRGIYVLRLRADGREEFRRIVFLGR